MEKRPFEEPLKGATGDEPPTRLLTPAELRRHVQRSADEPRSAELTLPRSFRASLRADEPATCLKRPTPSAEREVGAPATVFAHDAGPLRATATGRAPSVTHDASTADTVFARDAGAYRKATASSAKAPTHDGDAPVTVLACDARELRAAMPRLGERVRRSVSAEQLRDHTGPTARCLHLTPSTPRRLRALFASRSRFVVPCAAAAVLLLLFVAFRPRDAASAAATVTSEHADDLSRSSVQIPPDASQADGRALERHAQPTAEVRVSDTASPAFAETLTTDAYVQSGAETRGEPRKTLERGRVATLSQVAAPAEVPSDAAAALNGQDIVSSQRRAAELLLTGRMQDALDAYRALAEAHPEQPVFATIVTVLRHELSCAEQGSAPCR